jgi:hypothetical protein
MAGQLRNVKTLKFRGRVPSYFFIFVKVMGTFPRVTLGHITIPF